MTNIRTLTLGMGCFWGPEALFGALHGVIRTRVGYAGGTTDRPTYREMGDHSEVVQVDFDEELLSYELLLETFWSNHNPVNINGYKGRQYQSMLLYRNADQQEVFHRVKQRTEVDKGTLETEISPCASFYLAEPRHQKYYLKRYPDALAKLSERYPTEKELMNATLAARLNGLAKGYTNLGRIVDEIGRWSMDDSERAETIALIRGIRW